MDPEDYPSDSDASDEDFRPNKEDDGSISEEESDDSVEGHDAKVSDEEKKRKRKTKKTSNKKAKHEMDESTDGKEPAKEEKQLDEEDEERLTDALWADFLAGSSNGSATTSSSKPAAAKKDLPKTQITSESTKTAEPAQTTTVKKVFEYAGEAVEVMEEIPKSKLDSSIPPGRVALGSSNGNSGSSKPLLGRSSGGGLGAVLSQIGKKNKLSTLEKTKLDWNSFKRSQGIEEELQTHNKGKDGYLERQDFLQRADIRQFEIEKSFRQTTRSNR